jgi:hypothetical protein
MVAYAGQDTSTIPNGLVCMIDATLTAAPTGCLSKFNIRADNLNSTVGGVKLINSTDYIVLTSSPKNNTFSFFSSTSQTRNI